MLQEKFRGVLPGPTGSEVRRRFGINNGNLGEMFGTEEGLRAVRAVTESYLDATIGTASTFRITGHRAVTTGKWAFDPHANLELDPDHRRWNEAAVQIARAIYTRRAIFGSVAPITNTSENSRDDAAYLGIGDRNTRIEFSRQRQLPQLRVLANAGVDGLLGEAFRFRDDALGFARAAADCGVKLVVVSFEPSESGFPDPEAAPDGYSFDDMRKELQSVVGSDVTVLVGVNCTGTRLTQRLIDQREPLDVVYPNSADMCQPLAPATVKQIFAELSEACDGTMRDRIFSLLSSAVATPIDRLEALWRSALEAGASTIGICCGGTPEHVKAARRVFDAHVAATNAPAAIPVVRSTHPAAPERVQLRVG